MKRTLLIVAAAAVGCILLCAGILFWAFRSGSQLQANFFAAVDSGDVKQVQALMHPTLREEVDLPVLEAWMKEIRAKLGKFQGLSKTDFSTSTKYESGGKLTESKGTVNFERGPAQSQLVFRDGQLVSFSIRADKLGDDWFQGPADASLYHERGKKFLTHFLSGESDRAFGMMHTALQKEMPSEKFKELVADITAKAGKLQSIAHAEDRFDTTKGQRLKVYYTVECEHARTTAQVDFQFVGLQGHLLAFDLTGEAPPGAEGASSGTIGKQRPIVKQPDIVKQPKIWSPGN